MQKLILCRGIPASGKSTYAKAWVHAGENRVRVSRDDIRLHLFGKMFGVDERAVTKVEDATILAALKAGKSVIVDDTNITPEWGQRIARIGFEQNVQVSVKQFDISLDEAIKRNQARSDAGGNFVPVDVIKKMHDRLQSVPVLELERPETNVYKPDERFPKAILVDVDGTLAHNVGRSPYDWKRVGEDIVDVPVKTLVNQMYGDDFYVIILSGRDGVCYQETLDWLIDNGIQFDALYMRAEGDSRKDSIVKRELFDKHIRDNYNVLFVLDDRQQVVDTWRAMGLKCLQVQPGDF